MKHLPSLHICKKQISKQNLFVFWKITFVELTKKYLEKLKIEKFRLVRIMMMMMLIFCREMVYQKSASNFISSKGYLSELPSQVSDISPALFQPVQKLSLSSVGWDCRLVITETPDRGTSKFLARDISSRIHNENQCHCPFKVTKM